MYDGHTEYFTNVATKIRMVAGRYTVQRLLCTVESCLLSHPHLYRNDNPKAKWECNRFSAQLIEGLVDS